MKRYGPIALTLFIAAAFLAPMSCKKVEPEGRLILSSFLGNVTLKTAEGDRAPSVGEALAVGSTLVTGDMAMADILMDDRGIIRIHQNSAVLIDSLDEKGIADTELDMTNGKLYVTLSKLSKGGLRIKTPTAVASVRGTVFSVSAEEGVSRLDVVSGRVAINPVSESAPITEVEQVVEAEQTVSIDHDAVKKAVRAVEKKEAMVLKVEALKSEERNRITDELRNIKPELIEKLNRKARDDVRKKIFSTRSGDDESGTDRPEIDRDEIKKKIDAKKEELRLKARLKKEKLIPNAEETTRLGRERAEQEAKELIETQRLEKERVEQELKAKIEKERKQKEVRDRASNIPTL